MSDKGGDGSPLNTLTNSFRRSSTPLTDCRPYSLESRQQPAVINLASVSPDRGGSHHADPHANSAPSVIDLTGGEKFTAEEAEELVKAQNEASLETGTVSNRLSTTSD